jgi:hypothetical protein
MAEDGRTVDDGCASLVELEAVKRNRGVGKEGREGRSLGGGEVSLLKTEDVGGGEEVAEEETILRRRMRSGEVL